MKTCKRLLAALSAAVLLGALSTSASARSLSISSQTFRGTWREVRLEAAFGNTVCQMTLEGSFHARTIAKVSGALIGYVTSGRLGPCASGTATILTATLPWHIAYESFSGTLPSIGSFSARVINMGLALREPFGIVCLYRTTFLDYARWFAALVVSSQIGGIRQGGSIPVGPECFNARVTSSSDEGRVTVLNSSPALTVRLI